MWVTGELLGWLPDIYRLLIVSVQTARVWWHTIQPLDYDVIFEQCKCLPTMEHLSRFNNMMMLIPVREITKVHRRITAAWKLYIAYYNSNLIGWIQNSWFWLLTDDLVSHCQVLVFHYDYWEGSTADTPRKKRKSLQFMQYYILNVVLKCS